MWDWDITRIMKPNGALHSMVIDKTKQERILVSFFFFSSKERVAVLKVKSNYWVTNEKKNQYINLEPFPPTLYKEG